jgi:hypothetical protein
MLPIKNQSGMNQRFYAFLNKFSKNGWAINIGYWSAFGLIVLFFLFKDSREWFIRAFLFLAGFIYGKIISDKRALHYVQNYTLPGCNNEFGKYLDFSKYVKAFPQTEKIFLIIEQGIIFILIGLSPHIFWLIYPGIITLGFGIGRLLAVTAAKEDARRNFPWYIP